MEHVFGFREVNRYMGQLNGRVRRGVKDAMTDAALIVEGKVKEFISEGRSEWVRHSPATTARRGVGARILYDTGTMLRNVTHEVSDKMAIVGSPNEADPVHEFGTTRAGRGRHTTIPARPHYQPAVKETLGDVKRV